MSTLIERNTKYNGFPILVMRYSRDNIPASSSSFFPRDWFCGYIGIPKFANLNVNIKKIKTDDGRVVSYHEPHAPFMDEVSLYDYIGIDWFGKNITAQECFDCMIDICNKIEKGEF